MQISAVANSLWASLSAPGKPGAPTEVLGEVAAWLIRAHDAGADGGVSAGYSLRRGWLPSYPETTGYIICTFFDLAEILGREELRERAVRMADWEESIQMECGAFRGGFGNSPAQPVVFNTGQVLQGLVRAFKETGRERYLVAARRAGDWLVRVQSADGAWPHHEYMGVPHAYHTRVAWPLLDLWQATGEEKYREAAVRNLEWDRRQLGSDAWLDNCAFAPGQGTYTHTIGYAVEGFIEAAARLDEPRYLEAARAVAEKLLRIWEIRRRMPGEFRPGWGGDFSYTCLTGDAQIALCWLKLYRVTADGRYLSAALKMNDFLAGLISRQKVAEIRGALAGSHPVWGKYCRLFYPNWAAKFYADALMLAMKAGHESLYSPSQGD